MRPEFDIVIRKVTGYGYLGIIVIHHKEVYRTWEFHPTPEKALQAVLNHLDNDAEHDGMVS